MIRISIDIEEKGEAFSVALGLHGDAELSNFEKAKFLQLAFITLSQAVIAFTNCDCSSCKTITTAAELLGGLSLEVTSIGAIH